MSSPQLFLYLGPTAANPDAATRLEAVLAGGDVAAVVLGSAETDKAAQARLKAMVASVQAAGAAALLFAPSDPREVARLGADGAHYPHGHAGFDEGFATLKPDRIVGVGNLRTRHEAMEQGERGVDYVMFGEPRADGFVPETEKTVERAAWWAEIFQIPCVAYATSVTDAGAMAETGADFIAAGDWLLAETNEISLAAMKAAIKNERTR